MAPMVRWRADRIRIAMGRAGQAAVNLRPGRLFATPSVQVFVQVSPGGQPGEANATWLGESGPVSPSVDGPVITIQLRPSGS